MTEEVIHDPIFLAGKLELTANENLYNFYRNIGFTNNGVNSSKFMLTDQDYGSTIDYIEQNFYKDLICK